MFLTVRVLACACRGCTVGELKQPRKGHEHAFRVDLADKDSLG